MPWKGIGVAVAVIVATLVLLGSANGLVVDWAWFSTIGYVGVFWTVFSTKAVLFIAVFAVSTLLLWVSGGQPYGLRRGADLGFPWCSIRASGRSGHCPGRRPSGWDRPPRGCPGV